MQGCRARCSRTTRYGGTALQMRRRLAADPMDAECVIVCECQAVQVFLTPSMQGPAHAARHDHQ